MSATHPPIKVGTQVRTTKENASLRGEWAAEAHANRKWGMTGVVSDYSDAHGLCYEVYHKDQTHGWYDPSEFEITTTYVTQYVKNLATGESFAFEVPQETLDRLELQKRYIENGEASPLLGTVQELTEMYEFSFFPSYHEVRKIFFDNGYTDKLATQILTEFGLTEPSVSRLINNPNFVHNVAGWFESITQDGERAARTLKIVYLTVKGLLK